MMTVSSKEYEVLLEARDKRIAYLEDLLKKVPQTYVDEWDEYNCIFCGEQYTHEEDCPHKELKEVQS